MIEFNSKNIIVGFIKQLLYSFNLPTCKVFRNKAECLNHLFPSTNTTLKQRRLNYNSNIVCIIRNFKDNKDCFVKVDGNKNVEFLTYYNFGEFYPNLTKTLRIDNIIYDSYTHNYLGEYLRFIRDIKDINLLSLYNCYDTNIIEENEYKYFIIPVKYNYIYEICLDNPRAFSYAFVIDEKENIDNLIRNNQTNFNISTEISDTDYSQIIRISSPSITTFNDLFKEELLKLVIKVPVTNDSAICVLESSYTQSKLLERKKINRHYSPIKINFEKTNDEGNISHSSLDKYEYQSEYEKIFKDNIPVGQLQLINKIFTSKISYPFADRLTEYICGNVVTPLDYISRDIIDAKHKARDRYFDPNNNIPYRPKADYTIMERFKMLDLVIRNKLLHINKDDLLGYVDKDIEALLDDERYPLNN